MNSEFTVVKYKKKKKVNKKHLHNLTLHLVEDNCKKPLTEVIRTIEFIETEVSTSSYYRLLLQTINNLLKLENLLDLNQEFVIDILCYGLGHFSTNVNARYQFGLLLNLKKHFKSNVLIYDPIFNEIELDLLKNYEFDIITINEKGKRKINKLTLVYFPHCPHWLVNNFLWKNWGLGLSNCIIFSNSFNEIVLNNSDNNLKKKLGYLFKIQTIVEEVNLDNSFKYNDIFNSLSLHTFPKDKLKDILNDNSNDLEEPLYNYDSEEDIKENNISEVSKDLRKKLIIK